MKKYLFLLLACITLYPPMLCAQSQTIGNNKFNTGFDGRQGFYLGIDHKFNSYSLGLDAGTSFGVIYPTHFFSITLNNNLYLGKSNNYGVKVWFINARITYSQVLQELSNKPSLLSFTPAIGREFNFNQRYGVRLDLGVNIILSNKSTSSVPIPTGTLIEYSNSVVPSIRLNLFCRY